MKIPAGLSCTWLAMGRRSARAGGLSQAPEAETQIEPAGLQQYGIFPVEQTAKGPLRLPFAELNQFGAAG